MDPKGACKASVMSFVDTILIMKWCTCSSYPGLVRDDLALYADRSQSPGKLQPSLVCQVTMPWSRPGGERPEVR